MSVKYLFRICLCLFVTAQFGFGFNDELFDFNRKKADWIVRNMSSLTIASCLGQADFLVSSYKFLPPPENYDQALGCLRTNMRKLSDPKVDSKYLEIRKMQLLWVENLKRRSVGLPELQGLKRRFVECNVLAPAFSDSLQVKYRECSESQGDGIKEIGQICEVLIDIYQEIKLEYLLDDIYLCCEYLGDETNDLKWLYLSAELRIDHLLRGLTLKPSFEAELLVLLKGIAKRDATGLANSQIYSDYLLWMKSRSALDKDFFKLSLRGLPASGVIEKGEPDSVSLVFDESQFKDIDGLKVELSRLDERNVLGELSLNERLQFAILNYNAFKLTRERSFLVKAEDLLKSMSPAATNVDVYLYLADISSQLQHYKISVDSFLNIKFESLSMPADFSRYENVAIRLYNAYKEAELKKVVDDKDALYLVSCVDKVIGRVPLKARKQLDSFYERMEKVIRDRTKELSGEGSSPLKSSLAD